jgi:hypothetical protein
MGFGVLDDHRLEHVPGTALLADLHDQSTVRGADAARLKHDKSGNVVLVPQVLHPFLRSTKVSHLMILTIHTIGLRGKKVSSPSPGFWAQDMSAPWVL